MVTAYYAGRLARGIELVVIGYTLLWFLADSDRGPRELRIVGLVMVGTLLLAAIGWAQQGGRRPWVVGTLVVVLLTGLVAGAWTTARRAVGIVRAGGETSLGIGPMRIGPGASLVDADSASPGLPGDGPCHLLLGSAAGVTILLVDGDVWRVPSSSLTTSTRRCELADAVLSSAVLPAGWSVGEPHRARVDVDDQLWWCGDRPADPSPLRTTALLTLARDGLPVARGVQSVQHADSGGRVGLASTRAAIERCRQGWTQPLGSTDVRSTAHVGDLLEIALDDIPVGHVAWQQFVTITGPDGFSRTDQSMFVVLEAHGYVTSLFVTTEPGVDVLPEFEALARAAGGLLDEVAPP